MALISTVLQFFASGVAQGSGSGINGTIQGRKGIQLPRSPGTCTPANSCEFRS